MPSLLFIIIATSGLLVHVLPLHTSVTATTEGRLIGEVNVLLGVEADQKAGDIDNLFPDTDVSLANEDTGVVDRLRESKLEDLGLEPPLQEILNLQAENEIELHVVLVEHSNPDETTKQCVSLEQPPGVFLLQGEQLTSSLTDVGKNQLHSPHLTLVPQTEFTDQLQLLVQASLLAH